MAGTLAVMLLAYSTPRQAKTVETFLWIEKNAKWLSSHGIRLDLVEVGKDRRYQEAIVSRWKECAELGWQLIVLEHDEVPTREMVRRLLTCPEELCAQEYLLVSCRLIPRPYQQTYTCESHGTHPSCRHVGPTGDAQDWKWAKRGDQWVDYWGLGLTRFRPELMRRFPPDWPYRNCGDIDSQMSVYFYQRKVRGHAHWPLMIHRGASISYHPPFIVLWNHDETEVVARFDFAGRNVLGIFPDHKQ